MAPIINMLKSMAKISTVKFDNEANAAVRANNTEICKKAEDAPEEGSNITKLNEMTGRETAGAEASFYNFEGSSAEEFVALLLYKDFDKYAALETKPKAGEGETGLESPLLNSRTMSVGISNKGHSKCLNSIQIIYIFSLVNKLNVEEKAAEGGEAGSSHAMM